MQDDSPKAAKSKAKKAQSRARHPPHRPAQAVAERADKVRRERGSDWLVIAGTEEALGEQRGVRPWAAGSRAEW